MKLVSLILSSMENEWSSHNIQNLLIGCVNDNYAQKSEVTKFLISCIENINRIDVISKSNCMKVVKALAWLGKFNRELKFQYLVQAIEESNFDVVEFVLEDEPSLVRETLKEDCFEVDENNKEVYFAKKGDSISELAYGIEKHSKDCLDKIKKDKSNQEVSKLLKKERNNMKKISKLIRQVEKTEEKIRNISPLLNDSNSTKYPGSDIEDEIESDTESLLSTDDEDSNPEDFEVIDVDEEKLSILELEENPRGTIHDPLVTHSGLVYSPKGC